MSSTKQRHLLKQALVVAIVGGIAFFFWRAVRDNWAQIQQHDFELHPALLGASFVAVVSASLLPTYAWQLALHGLSGRRDMTFANSVGAVNSSSLTKYLPGKFWSYALQMYWLAQSGYSKTLVLYVNLLNLVVSLLTGVLVAFVFLLFSGKFAWPLIAAGCASLLVVEAALFFFNADAFRLAARVVRRLFKRELSYIATSKALLLRVHAVQLLAQIVSGLGAYLICLGIGFDVGASTILLVMAALILSDTAGFLFFPVPGGIGVREATMYFLLQGQDSESLALVLPLVSRALYMAADVLLGAVALWLLKRTLRAAGTEPGAVS